MDEQQLDEFFSVPVGLKEVDNIYGFKVYSSDRLVKAYLEAINRSGRGNQVYPPIEKLVKQKKIMPIYHIKGILRFLAHKMFGSPEDKAILGFYHMGVKRVYIMIDNNISVFGHAKNDEIASTTIHECQHLFADMNRSKFMSIFNEQIYRYYTSAFSRIFQLNTIPKKEISNIINFIGKFEGESLNKVTQKLDSYIKAIQPLQEYSTLNQQEFNKRMNDITLIIRIFTERFDLFLKIYRKYTHIFGPLDRAYRDAFGKRNLYTTPYQELISLSEVICVLSEIKPGDPKIKQGFKTFS
jgi:hypothetical protein